MNVRKVLFEKEGPREQFQQRDSHDFGRETRLFRILQYSTMSLTRKLKSVKRKEECRIQSDIDDVNEVGTETKFIIKDYTQALTFQGQ